MHADLVLEADAFRHYIDDFNKGDNERYPQACPNSDAWDFLKGNIPFFECPDKEIERTYYFRWWTYRKHIKQTPDGFVISEFLPPVSWARKHNTINCAAGHHLYEGRWLHDPKYLDDYSVFWFRKGGVPRHYSFWAADAIWARCMVNGNAALVKDLLPDLVRNWEAWASEHRDASGLFWQDEGLDGMENSIGGSGCRATINSYQYGDAVAIAKIAELAGQPDLAGTYRKKAAELKRLVQDKLWDKAAQFFKVLPRGDGKKLADVREEHGFTPWYFALPDPEKSVAWKQLMDHQGFYAPFGPTTAEQRHPKFAVVYHDPVGHTCQWNGPSWPYATTVTLVALANLLNNYQQDVVTKRDYFETLKCYTRSHVLREQRLEVVGSADGLDNTATLPPIVRVTPGEVPAPDAAALNSLDRQAWIDENLNPYTGDWVARSVLSDRKQNAEERGKDYNHSSYGDLIITGLVGLRPRADNIVEVNPLLPAQAWQYFCLDNVRYHDVILTIVWDKSGRKYGMGQGLRVFADGKQIAFSKSLSRVTGAIA